jgi:hypothetical protein
MRRVAGSAVRFLLATLVACNLAHAATITITGSWSLVIGAGNLTGGPGTNLTATYTSATNQVLMGVTTTLVNWRVDISRLDSLWHANLVLSIRRTGTGSGTGSVTGGGSYQAITTTNQTFVTGSGNRAGIQLQERIGGVSVSIPVATYTTTIQPEPAPRCGVLCPSANWRTARAAFWIEVRLTPPAQTSPLTSSGTTMRLPPKERIHWGASRSRLPLTTICPSAST